MVRPGCEDSYRWPEGRSGASPIPTCIDAMTPRIVSRNLLHFFRFRLGRKCTREASSKFFTRRSHETHRPGPVAGPRGLFFDDSATGNRLTTANSPVTVLGEVVIDR